MKRNSTYLVHEVTPAVLQALAAQLGIIAERGSGAGQLGSASALLDRLAAATLALGAETVAAHLRPVLDEHDRRWKASRE